MLSILLTVFSPLQNFDSPLVLVVTDKDDVQGQVTIPLNNLPSESSRRKMKFPLQPHKKCQHPHGELVFEAWISSVKESLIPPEITITKTSDKEHNIIKKIIAKSPILHRKNISRDKEKNQDDEGKRHTISTFFSKSPVLRRKHHNEVPLNNTSKQRLNSSLQDLTSIDKIDNNLNEPTRPDTIHGGLLSVNQKENWKSKSSTDLTSSVRPEIRSVVPNTIPCDGGDMLTIRGSNLGTHKEDIVGLFVCGANLLGTVKYISSEEVSCISKMWRVSIGNIVIETQSGGRTKSLVQIRMTESKKQEDTSKKHSEESNKQDTSKGYNETSKMQEKRVKEEQIKEKEASNKHREEEARNKQKDQETSKKHNEENKDTKPSAQREGRKVRRK